MKLFIVATPIGNLKDITLRAIEVLKTVDLVLAEDTKITIKLLNHLGIHKRLFSCNKLNENDVAKKLEEMFKKAEKIALLTDAGTPGISDPGSIVVKTAYTIGAKVTVIPGACSLAAAVSIAGFTEKQFVFLQFLPRKQNEQKQEILKAQKSGYPLVVFFESPNRIIKTLENFIGIANDVAVFNDLTKLHERCYRGDVESVVSELSANENSSKGEYVVVLKLNDFKEAEEKLSLEEKLYNEMKTKNLTAKEAIVTLVAKGENKNALYKASLNIKK